MNRRTNLSPDRGHRDNKAFRVVPDNAMTSYRVVLAATFDYIAAKVLYKRVGIFSNKHIVLINRLFICGNIKNKTKKRTHICNLTAGDSE